MNCASVIVPNTPKAAKLEMAGNICEIPVSIVGLGFVTAKRHRMLTVTNE